VTSRLRVDLGALAANYRTLRAGAEPGACGAVVKANGYGLGAVAVAERLAREGCQHFFVATAAEALELRQSLPDPDIYVFWGVTEHSADDVVAARAIPVINHEGQLAAWRRRGPIAVHVDTGMNRLGFDPDTVQPAHFEGAPMVLLLTHLACADEPDHPLNRRQLARFAEVAARFPGVPTSIGNSAATLNGSAWCGDIARPGIALYGGNPFPAAGNRMHTVATLEAEVLQLRRIEVGTPVGYGATYLARGPRLIATVGAGYADGVPRLLSNLGEAGYLGRRLPYVGRVSMDLLTVDATEVADRIAVGDWVELVGDQISVDETAVLARTIGYEILTGLGRRARREYREAST